MDVTRRTLARMFAATAAVPLAEAAPQAAVVQSDEDRSAHELLRSNAQQLAKVALPMAIEPACHFKA